MYTGIVRLIPFITTLLIILFLSRGFAKVFPASSVNKVLAVLWGLCVFVLLQAQQDSFAVLMNSLFQIYFVYLYLQIFHDLKHRIVTELVFIVVGAFTLSFLILVVDTVLFFLS